MAETKYNVDSDTLLRLIELIGKIYPKTASTEEDNGVVDFADLLGNVFLSFIAGDLQVKNWDSRNFHGVKIVEVDDDSFDFGIGDYQGNLGLIFSEGKAITKNSSSTNAHVEGTTLVLD